jgi:hypothetical protein
VTAESPVAEGPETGPSLEIPAEPVELRAGLRRSVLDGGEGQHGWGNGLAVGDGLWTHWGPALEAAGMDRRSFDEVVVGYRRELWFWLLGERTWESAVSGLAGRLRRRLPR